MSTVRFETPENILVTYRLAGPGTRFIAYFFDLLIILFAFLLVGLAMVLVGLALQDLVTEPMMYAAGVIFVVALGFVSIAYFGLFEWFTNGHTPGKRAAGIRVVMDEGFSLTFTGVVIRNVFRILDTIPILWIVPVVTKRVQRFGDIVAGTLVVSELGVPINPLREALAVRPADEARYAVNAEHLNRLRDVDIRAIETFLERRPRLFPAHRQILGQRLARALSERLGLLPPDTDEERELFLEDVLAAYARREARELG